MKYFLLFFFFLVVTTYSNPILQKDLPRFNDIDDIEVYHLRSFPSLLIETSAGSFKTQTSGLALRTPNNVIIVSYKPRNYTSCFLPYFTEGSELLWDKYAEIIFEDKVDVQFWQQSTFVTRINGVVYKKYLNFLQDYLDRNRYFAPQSICSNEFEYNCFFRASTWDTFVSDSLHFFSALSVRIDMMIPPRAKEIRILSHSNPSVVQFLSDEKNSTIDPQSLDIINYYSNLLSCMQEFQLKDFSTALESCISNKVSYVHIRDTSYYKFDPRYPYVYVLEYSPEFSGYSFSEFSGLDSEDFVGVFFLFSIALVGIVSTLLKINYVLQNDSYGTSESSLRRIWARKTKREEPKSRSEQFNFRN